METIKKTLGAVMRQPPKSLCKQLQTVSTEHELSKNGSCNISIFTGQQASNVQVVTTIAKLSIAFPDMKKDFFDLLTEQIIKSEISSKRLEYALNNILNTFRYKQLNIADLLSIDIKCKVYSYSEMLNEMHKNATTMSLYTKIFFGDNQKPNWITVSDKERYGLPDRV